MRVFLATVVTAACVIAALASCDAAIVPLTPRIPRLLKTIPVKAFNASAEVVTNPRTGNVYLMLDDHVTILKGTEIITNLKTTNKWAESIAVDLVTDRAYVANTLENTVSVIESTRWITNITTFGRDPAAVVIEPRSRLAYVISRYGKTPYDIDGSLTGNVLILDGSRMVGNIRLPQIVPTHIVADAVGGFVYVGDVMGGVVAIKDTEVVARFEAVPDRNGPGAVLDMQVDPRTGEVFVLDSRGNLRTFKDGKGVDVTRLVNVYALGIHPQTGYRYLINQAEKTVLITQGWQEIKRVSVQFGRQAHAQAMAIDSFTGNVYISDFTNDTITVINGTEHIGTLKTGWHPSAIGVNPANGWVYVVNIGDSTVSVFGYQ